MRGTLKLKECRELTPPVDAVGEWAKKLRDAAFNAVKEADMTELMAGLMKRAKEGDNAAAKIVLTYLTGGGAPAPKASITLPPALTELIEALTDKLESGEPLNGKGPPLQMRDGSNGFEVLSTHATEQAAEKELRRLIDERRDNGKL